MLLFVQRTSPGVTGHDGHASFQVRQFDLIQLG